MRNHIQIHTKELGTCISEIFIDGIPVYANNVKYIHHIDEVCAVEITFVNPRVEIVEDD